MADPRTVFSCIFIVLLLLFGIVYLYFRRKYEYWSKRGIYTISPIFPFGNIKDIFLGKSQFGLNFCQEYERTKHIPYVGLFMVVKPALVVNDLELIKNILTKDFVHFSGHGFPYNEEVEPLTGHLFNADGAKWKHLRVKLTPTFTSSKMRMMFDTVAACAEEMSDYLEKQIEFKDVDDVKELLATFGNDVIANCAFGIECKTFKNPDDKFRKMGKRIFNPSIIENFMGLIDFFVPNVITKFKALLGKSVEEFFLDVVEQTVKYRETNGIVRNDFMHLLIQLKNTGSVSDDVNNPEKSEAQVDDGTRLTMMQLAAQVFVFFIAGFETSSTTASFALYELALNPDIQATLAEEIDKVLAEHDGKVTYDSLNDMTYMTKVIEETMRKYPALPILFRICTKEYKIPDTDIIIEKGTPVMIPIYGIQRDPEYYPNPNKFDPERFSPENKESRHHFAYLPFGEGPRICIGIRFGMMQTKLGLATILSKYEVSVCDKTKIPIEYDKKSFVLTSEGGVWLNLKKRVK